MVALLATVGFASAQDDSGSADAGADSATTPPSDADRSDALVGLTEGSIDVDRRVDDDAINRTLSELLDASRRLGGAAAEGVEVEVDGGVVRLTGGVPSLADSDRLAAVASKIQGVVMVVNDLEVASEVDLEATTDQVTASVSTLWRDFISRSPLLLAALVVVVITAILAKLVAWLLTRVLSKRKRIRYSLKDLIYQLTNLGVWIIGLLVAAVIAFPGMTPSKALTVLGLGSVAIGFAFKDIFENFFAGILILWRYPFDRGDFIRCGDILGCVEEITIRNSMIRQLDGELAVVPNATLFKETVYVLTNSKSRRVQVICGVGYGEDVDAARSVIEKAVKKCVTMDGTQVPEVLALEFGDSSVNFEITWWTGSRPGDIRRSRDEVVSSVKRALDDAGIEIPFPYRTLTFAEPVPIGGADATNPSESV